MKDQQAKPKSDTSLIAVRTTFLSSYVAVLCLGYMCVFACACPRPELLIAMSTEIGFFAILLAWRYFRGKSGASIGQKIVLSELKKQQKIVGIASGVYRRTSFGLWLIIAIGLTIDFFSLSAAFFRHYPVSETLYSTVPVSVLVGAHPAASAEMLEGAYVQSGQRDIALQLLTLVRDVRLRFYGADNEMIVAVDADCGDFFFKSCRYADSEKWYKKSIALSRAINGKTGYGRPLTGLANCYKARGDYSSAETAYQDALAIRERLYGKDSLKAVDTLECMKDFYEQTGQKRKMEAIAERIKHIRSLSKESENTDPMIPALVFCFVTALSYFLLGPKGHVTAVVIRKLKSKIDSSQAPAAEDVARYNALCRYQNGAADKSKDVNADVGPH